MHLWNVLLFELGQRLLRLVVQLVQEELGALHGQLLLLDLLLGFEVKLDVVKLLDVELVQLLRVLELDDVLEKWDNNHFLNFNG
jgi:hypothetical protein